MSEGVHGEVTAVAAATGSKDPEVALGAVAALRGLVEVLEALNVEHARAQGWSWEAIATRLGVTKQAVHKEVRGQALPAGEEVRVRDRFADQARRVLDLARVEADGLGQRYLGPEHVVLHVVLGVLRDGSSAAAHALRAHGLELEEARAELGRLGERGVVAGPRPSDAELLGALGIDLDAVRQCTEGMFGSQAVAQATREATRARRRGIARVPRTPLEGPPLLIGRTLHFAGERADALGHATVGPDLLLLGVLDDITRPWPRCTSNR